MRRREKLHTLWNRFTAIYVHISYICMYLIFSRFCRPPLLCISVHYRIVMTLTTNSSPESTQATSLSYSKSLLKYHPSSRENLALFT